MRLLRQKIFFNYQAINKLYGKEAENFVRQARSNRAKQILEARKAARSQAKETAGYAKENYLQKVEDLKSNPELDYGKLLNGHQDLKLKLGGIRRDLYKTENELGEALMNGKITRAEYDRFKDHMHQQLSGGIEKDIVYGDKRFKSVLEKAGKEQSEQYKKANADIFERTLDQSTRKNLDGVYKKFYGNQGASSFDQNLNEELRKRFTSDGYTKGFIGDRSHAYDLNNLWMLNEGKVSGLRNNAKVSINRKTGKWEMAHGEVDDATYAAQEKALAEQRAKTLAEQKAKEEAQRKAEELRRNAAKNEIYSQKVQKREEKPSFSSKNLNDSQKVSNNFNEEKSNTKAVNPETKSNTGRNIAIGTGLIGASGLAGYGLYKSNKKREA